MVKAGLVSAIDVFLLSRQRVADADDKRSMTKRDRHSIRQAPAGGQRRARISACTSASSARALSVLVP
jgi:hypothetical protein